MKTEPACADAGGRKKGAACGGEMMAHASGAGKRRMEWDM